MESKNIRIQLIFYKIVIILLVAGISYSIFYYLGAITGFQNRINQLETDVQKLVSGLREKDSRIVAISQEIESKNLEIQDQYRTIQNLELDIEKQRIQIQSLNLQVNSLGTQLGKTKSDLQETNRLLVVAKEFEDRVINGVAISKAYVLLGDYDKTARVVSKILNMSAPTTPANDQEIWSRGKKIYEWLALHYDYCSDKGFCISDDKCTVFQFYSPDELVYYGEMISLCGDCDDKAQLFAGMLYASGVPHNKVRVECGVVPGGGHCWTKVNLNNNWYRVDPVCSDSVSFVLQKFGLSFLMPAAFPSSSYRDVECFSNYTTEVWYNPEGYHEV